MNVVKVDRDVAYVAMVVHVCCKLLFQGFICFFRRMLQVCLFNFAYVSHICVQLFVLQWFLGVFVSVLDACFKCSICFTHML